MCVSLQIKIQLQNTHTHHKRFLNTFQAQRADAMPSGPIADTGVDQTSADPGFPFVFFCFFSFLLFKPAPQYHRQCGTSHFCTAEDIELHLQRAPGCRYSPVGRYKALLCHWRCHHELSPVSHIHHVKLSARVRLSSPSAARAPLLVFPLLL